MNINLALLNTVVNLRCNRCGKEEKQEYTFSQLPNTVAISNMDCDCSKQGYTGIGVITSFELSAQDKAGHNIEADANTLPITGLEGQDQPQHNVNT